MRNRTKARECALKILYAVDIRKDTPEECARTFWMNHAAMHEDIKEFTNYLIDGIFKNKEFIDGIISKYATNWQIQRMATIDRNILRLATFEILFGEDIPIKVSINEAIEMAKKYGDRDSGKFVNGVLDKINKSEKKST
ncbi:MAG: transcription antitermination factor NusB [Omnitrophica bacterium RBG_13_46_9]|nr:MAG: transcription antitermination factor NusB [Omnitrophica bacterium RBG_13_46_9]